VRARRVHRPFQLSITLYTFANVATMTAITSAMMPMTISSSTRL
jgi:hypothetical protein